MITRRKLMSLAAGVIGLSAAAIVTKTAPAKSIDHIATQPKSGAGKVEIWVYPVGDEDGRNRAMEAASEQRSNGRSIILKPWPDPPWSGQLLATP